MTPTIILPICLTGLLFCFYCFYRNKIVYNVRMEVLKEIRIEEPSIDKQLEMLEKYPDNYEKQFWSLFTFKAELKRQMRKQVGLKT